MTSGSSYDLLTLNVSFFHSLDRRRRNFFLSHSLSIALGGGGRCRYRERGEEINKFHSNPRLDFVLRTFCLHHVRKGKIPLGDSKGRPKPLTPGLQPKTRDRIRPLNPRRRPSRRTRDGKGRAEYRASPSCFRVTRLVSLGLTYASPRPGHPGIDRRSDILRVRCSRIFLLL